MSNQSKHPKTKQPEGFRRNQRCKLLASWVILTGLMIALGGAVLEPPVSVKGQSVAAGWTEPRRLLPYISSKTTNLLVNPLDNSVTYLTISGAYGIVAGNELGNWQNDTYLKLGDQPGNDHGAAYDEFGTLHAVWAARNSNGQGPFNIFYNRVIQGSNNIGIYRNLTHEIFGDDSNTGIPSIGYSVQQKKLFLLFQEGREGVGLIWFSESADQGTSWSKPVQVGTLSGYAPVNPALTVDKAGNPHIIYGEMDATRGRILHRVRVNGVWSGPVDITASCCGRPLYPQLALAPNGDVWVSWFDGPIHLARFKSSTGQWQFFENVSGGANKGVHTIAVGSNGTIWVMWHNPAAGTLEYTLSTDDGASWKPVRTFAKTKDAYMGSVFGLASVAAKNAIYLLVTADQLDPKWIQYPTLFVTTIGENNFNPPPPTPNPSATSLPDPTNTIGLPLPTRTGTASVVVPTATPTASATATASATPTTSTTPSVLLGDRYEPDNTLDEVIARSRFLQPHQPEVHTLYDPRSADKSDIDLGLIQGEKGKTFTLSLVASGFQPKLSFYSYDGTWQGAANECNGDKSKLCFTFTPPVTGLYYAQFSNANGGPGNPNLVYSLMLTLNTALPVTATSTASVTATGGVATPTLAVNFPSATSTVVPSGTQILATATATATPTPTIEPPTATTTQAPTSKPVTTAPAAPVQVAQPPLPPPAAAATATPLPTNTPVPTATLVPEVVEATAYAQAQAEAARTPQVLVLPIMPAGSGGKGPPIAPATATLSPSPKAVATFTPLPTATPARRITVTAAPTLTPGVGSTSSSKAPAAPAPPPTGPLWALPIGLAALGKGLLNLMALKFKP